MAKTKENVINEIAQNLDCGDNCYYNTKSGEIITIPDYLDDSDDYELGEMWAEDLQRIEEHEEDFIKFEVLPSFDSFKIMERFTDQLPESELKIKLASTLRAKKPFQKFKHFIDFSGLRENWFAFKRKELEKIVEEQMNLGQADAQQGI